VVGCRRSKPGSALLGHGMSKVQRGMDTSALNQCQLLSSSSLVSLDKRDKPIQWPKGACHEPRFPPPSAPGPHVGLTPSLLPTVLCTLPWSLPLQTKTLFSVWDS